MYDSEMPDLKKLGKNQLTDFYEECVNKGFHHVDDPEQKKQIELLAMESGINYGSIDDLYEKSKQEYLAYKKNCEEAKKRQAAQSVVGRLIFSVATKYTQNSKRSSVGVYIRPDGSIYCELSAGWHRKYKHETRVEGIRFTAKEFSGGMFTYSPSKTIYTGATVGGVTTGGLHQTQAGYDFKYKKTGQGYITVRFGEEEEEIVTYIQLNSYGSFLYDGRYKDGRINCLRYSGDNSMGKAAMRTGNIYQVANAASAQNVFRSFIDANLR